MLDIMSCVSFLSLTFQHAGLRYGRDEIHTYPRKLLWLHQHRSDQLRVRKVGVSSQGYVWVSSRPYRRPSCWNVRDKSDTQLIISIISFFPIQSNSITALSPQEHQESADPRTWPALFLSAISSMRAHTARNRNINSSFGLLGAAAGSGENT